jgi:hypothetical protein
MMTSLRDLPPPQTWGFLFGRPLDMPADFFDILEALGVETKQATKAIRPDSDPEWGSVLHKRMFFHRGLT